MFFNVFYIKRNICFSNGQLILGDLGHEEAQTTLFYKAKLSKFALSYTAPELVRRSGVERNPENLNQLMKIDIWYAFGTQINFLRKKSFIFIK